MAGCEGFYGGLGVASIHALATGCFFNKQKIQSMKEIIKLYAQI